MVPKIVVIEDDVPIRDMYVTKLHSMGFDVKGADDGKHGLEVVEKFKPDLLLCDLRMPNMTGQEMLKKLRENDWGKDVLVIVLTNLSQSEASMDLRLLRIERYVVKAYFTPKQIGEIVTETLQKYGKMGKPQN